MARIAYVDHSYHEQTRSTLFLPELLSARGHDVDIFWDEAWRAGPSVNWESVVAYDAIVMFQSYCRTHGRSFRSLHPNVVYIPMFDQFAFSQNAPRDLTSFWEPFRGSKLLNFSTSLHALAAGIGIASHVVRYYPEVPVERPPLDGLHGFFWLRREAELGWATVRRLIGTTRFDSFNVHVVGDPGFPPVEPPPPDDVRTHNITVSSWFERKADFEAVASRANIYFAPRLEEGIGQTFLEAMARGQCVIAADNATMNEYIVHGVNGLVFDPRNPAPLDFADIDHLGQEARRGVIAGRARGHAAEDELVVFILTPSAAYYGDDISAGEPAKASDAPRRIGPTAALRRLRR
jgi:hypothetical protein